MKNLLIHILIILFSHSLLNSQTAVQGTILKTGINSVTIYGKPNTNLNAITFDNVIICVSIPSQTPDPTPTASITSNNIPNFTWTVPSGYPYTINGRTYFAFNGSDNSNGQTATWLSGTDNPIISITFTNGADGASEIVYLEDRTDSGGGPGFDYWYVQIVGPGAVTPYGGLFYGAGAINGPDSYVPTPLSVALPVELISFQAQRISDNTFLTWHTSSETNNDRFEVEHSLDGASFQTIGQVKGRGTSTEPHDYAFTHNNLNLGTHYYRLRQVDFDGLHDYSHVVAVTFSGIDQHEFLKLWPNPTTGILYLDGLIHRNTGFTIRDATGKAWMYGKSAEGQINVSALPAGIYFLSIETESGVVLRGQMVKQ